MRVLLCGKSLLISGLRASLMAAPKLELQCVDEKPEHVRECITAWQPEVVILEAELLKSTFSLSLLQDFPWLKLIGLEAEENRLVVFSGSYYAEPTPEELLKLITT
jgi:hypothetical protein